MGDNGIKYEYNKNCNNAYTDLKLREKRKFYATNLANKPTA
jgi:hypothetical protein